MGEQLGEKIIMSVNNENVKPFFVKYQEKLGKGLEHLKNEFGTYRAGRANPAVLDKILVDYWGTPTKIRDMANITVADARMLTITPYDQSAIKAINKAIQESDLGINPSDDGKMIRLGFPQLTEERRKDLIKNIKKTAEDSKIVLRNERRDMVEAVKKLKKDSLVTEDELAVCEKDIQKELDKAIETVEKMLKDKEKEVMEI